MNKEHYYIELEKLTQKIENNTASLDDYQKYENILLKGGLSQDYIHSYLNKAGFNTWEDLIRARQNKENGTSPLGAIALGGLIGIGLGLIIYKLIGNNSE